MNKIYFFDNDLLNKVVNSRMSWLYHDTRLSRIEFCNRGNISSGILNTIPNNPARDLKTLFSLSCNYGPSIDFFAGLTDCVGHYKINDPHLYESIVKNKSPFCVSNGIINTNIQLDYYLFDNLFQIYPTMSAEEKLKRINYIVFMYMDYYANR